LEPCPCPRDVARSSAARAKQFEGRDGGESKRPGFPPKFPAYRAAQSLNEAAAYLANASYSISVDPGASSRPQIRHHRRAGGRESRPLRPAARPLGEPCLPRCRADAKRDYRGAIQLHDPDEDSDGIVRRRLTTLPARTRRPRTPGPDRRRRRSRWRITGPKRKRENGGNIRDGSEDCVPNKNDKSQWAPR